MAGADMGTLNVDITTNGGSTWTNLWTQTGAVQATETDPFLLAHVDLTAYIGQSVQVRWQSITGPDFESDMAIDAISIYENVDNDLALDAIILPDAGDCGYGMIPVTVSIINRGTIAQSNFDVQVLVDAPTNDFGFAETINTSVNPGDTLNHTFSSNFNFIELGTHEIMAWTALPTDEAAGNDTSSLSIFNAAPITTFPYTQDFESFITCTTTGNAQECGVTNGWSQDENGVDDDNDWCTNNGGTGSPGTGPSDDHTL